MAYENEVLSYMERLKVADKHAIGGILAARGYYKRGVSAVNNAKKILDHLADTKKIERCASFYRVDSKSDYKDHAKKLTEVLAELMKVCRTVFIHREHTISEIGLRPDAIILLVSGRRATCILLEVCLTETESYLEMKRRAFDQWGGNLDYLSKLFSCKVPMYRYLTDEELKEAL